MLNTTCKQKNKEVFDMEQKNLVDIMYEALAERINVPKRMKEKSLKRYEEINSNLSKKIENPNTVMEILEIIDNFLDAKNDEIEFEKREYYKRGLLHYELLKNELTRENGILDNRKEKDKILDKIYESDIENIAVLSNKEKNICEKKCSKNNILKYTYETRGKGY